MEPFSSLRSAVRWRVSLSREMDERLNVLFGVLKGAAIYLGAPSLLEQARAHVNEFDAFRIGAHALEFKLRALLWEGSEGSAFLRKAAEHLQRYPRELFLESELNAERQEARIWAREAILSLPEIPKRVLILEGGVGLMAAQLLERLSVQPERVVSVERDAERAALAGRLLVDPRFSSLQGGALSVAQEDKSALVINHACDRGDFFAWWEAIPEGQLLLLQSCDSAPESRFSVRVPSLDAFLELAPLRELFVSASLPGKRYPRFFQLGRK